MHTSMAYKKTSAMLILLLSCMTSINTYAKGGEKSILKCIEDCQNICMKLDAVTALICHQACSKGCQQLQGKAPAPLSAPIDKLS